MTDLWFPPAIKAIVPGHWTGAGAWLGGLPKIVHHITGGATYAGAFSTYAKTGDLPHFTDSFEDGTYRVWQHLPLDTAATALKHPSGTPETNRARAIQIEHVVPSIDAVHLIPAGYYDGIAVLCRWIEAAFAVQRRAPYPFLNPRRLTWDEWMHASGHLGHCHVPGNDHPDPGPIDIDHILNAGVAAPPPAPGPITEVPCDMATLKTQLVPIPPLNAGGEAWLHIDQAYDEIVDLRMQGSNPDRDHTLYESVDIQAQPDGPGTLVTLRRLTTGHPVSSLFVKWVEG